MNPKSNSRKQDIPHIAPIQYIAINKTPQAKKFVVQFGKTPAVSMSDLQMKMAAITKQFGDEAKKELAKIHPDTGWIMKAMSSASKMEGGRSNGEFINSYGHAEGCKCPKCVGLEKHSNFVTNYRSDVDSPLNNRVMEMSTADGSSRIMAGASRAKEALKGSAWVLAIIALGIIVVASGEKQRGYN